MKTNNFPLFRSLLPGLENKQWAQVQAPEKQMCLPLLFRRCGAVARLSASERKLRWYGEDKLNKAVWATDLGVHLLTVLRLALMLSRHHRPKAFCVVFQEDETELA